MASPARSTASTRPPAPTLPRRLTAITEPSLGLDTVYDGAAEMQSTARLFGPKGGRWSTSQSYSTSFRSATPRPWNRVPTKRELGNQSPPLGSYDPWQDNHALSSSITWSSRGRTGPVGYPFRADIRSPQFQSNVGRTHFASRPKRGALQKEDYFVLASDARRDQLQRAEFVEQLIRRATQQVFRPPMATHPRPYTTAR